MKKNICLIIIAVFIGATQAQVINKDIASKVTDVTVYMSGAQITHTGTANLEKGEYNLTFSGISPNINEKSIQVTSNSDVKVTSVTYMEDYLEEVTETAEIKALKDTVKGLAKKILTISNQISVYKSEKDLILKNNDIKGTTNGMLTSELQKAADFFRTRLNEINTQTEKLNEQLEVYNEQQLKLQSQLTEHNSKQTQPVYKLSITATVKTATKCPFVIKYLVSDAGWAAFYDIRATDVNSPIQLDYKAKVFNDCNIDWSNVKLTLSTADPNKTAQRPTLTTWGLRYDDGYSVTQNYEGYLNTFEPYRGNIMAADSIKTDTKTNLWNNQYTTIEVSELSTEFEIVTPYNIPSDNKVYIVDIQTQELPASYKYISVPKMDKDAFLVAYINGWESLNLIEGSANVFYEGTYVGQSYINTRFTNDSLEISLGRDKKVSVTRIKKQDYSGKVFVGGNKKETLSYEITVRNNNKTAIDIEIQDQVPISQEDEIKVSVLETSGSVPDPLNGKLIYNYKLEPSESKSIVITFSVMYPKAKAGLLHLRKNRTVVSPRFL